jgi:bifunctional non-homologous end joining protein LigD
MALPQIEPIRPILSKAVPHGREWMYEPKLDGFRGVLYIERSHGLFRSKTNRFMSRFQTLADALARELHLQDAILDGEILVVGTDSKPDFKALMFRRGQPEYAAFDLLWLNGKDLRNLAYTKRKTVLRKLLSRQPAVGYVEGYSKPELFESAARLDLEGIVAKRRSDPYTPTTSWIKVRHSAYSQMEGRWELFQGKSK